MAATLKREPVDGMASLATAPPCMADTVTRVPVNTAFALGGLGGNNFHGLGFLHAAHERGLRPDMISCTSGQIYMVWKFLLANDGRLEEQCGMKDLKDLAQNYRDVAEIKPKQHLPDLFHDVPDLVCALIKHASDVESFRRSAPGYMLDTTLNIVLARVLEPDVDERTLKAICHDFNESGVAIAFNSYDPVAGVETVYLNPRAEEVLQRRVPMKSSFRMSDKHLTEYRPITTEGLINALWLYEYGFEHRSSIDGAYFRMVMLGELSRARTIFVARPIQGRWMGPMPVTYGEKEDLKTEVFFNAAYLGERFRIELVNRQLKRNALTEEHVEREGYHHVEIIEVEPRAPQPFVSYFSEEMQMFREAYEEARDVFDDFQARTSARR